MEQSELNQILERHKLWVETKGKQGVCADLWGAYLGGANLWGANLGGANLYGANLEDVSFINAYLCGANLEDVSFINAYLCYAKLTGAKLSGANLTYADLTAANLTGANLRGANLRGANLTGATGLPDISWIIPGCLAHLNRIRYSGFWLMKESKWENFIQDSFGFFIQDNPIEKTFDMLIEDRIIRNIPHWVKYSGLKQIESV